MEKTDEIGNFTGLTTKQVQQRRTQFGFNELPTSQPTRLVHLIWASVKEPMLLLLIICAFIYLLVGSIDEALLLLGSVLVILTISIYQERKSDQALKKLKALSSPRALVIRGGVQLRIPGREVVPGDLVILREGDRVVADGTLLFSQHLTVDESLLTGESVPVTKTKPSVDRLFSGTLVVAGTGLFQVTKTGSSTELGVIGELLGAESDQRTQLQIRVEHIVKRLGIVATGACVLLVALYGVLHSDWKTAFLAGIAMAISLLPEEFPVVLTIFLALGAWRLSQKKVLTRKPSAIENLGAATVLCVDKTGTLTLNQMTVKELWIKNGQHRFSGEPTEKLSEPFHEIVEYAVLASHRDPFDPIEIALRKTLSNYLENTHDHPDWQLVREYPLTAELFAMSCVWKHRDRYVIAAKGAPEAVIDLCHLNQDATQNILNEVNAMATRGLKVLGVCRSFSPERVLPDHQHGFDFEFLGLVGFEDPLRPEVPEAIANCHVAGIKVIMITGDYMETARSIAEQAGLLANGQILSAENFSTFTDSDLQREIQNAAVFARMTPQNKLRIVNALQANGEVVAMTGDGVNDAPSLKGADIGIAMGARGTDVAREASDLVLLDDRFTSIVEAIRLGRRIYNNIQKSMSYLLSIHILIAGASLFPVIFGFPLILYPVHLVFLELIIDPASTLVFEGEAEDSKIMDRPPRAKNDFLFNRRMFLTTLTQGLTSLGLVCGVYFFSLTHFQDEFMARGGAFLTVVFANLGIIAANMSQLRNKVFGVIVAYSMIFVVLSFNVGYLKNVFKLAPVPLLTIIQILGASLVLYFLNLFLKNHLFKQIRLGEQCES